MRAKSFNPILRNLLMFVYWQNATDFRPQIFATAKARQVQLITLSSRDPLSGKIAWHNVLKIKQFTSINPVASSEFQVAAVDARNPMIIIVILKDCVLNI